MGKRSTCPQCGKRVGPEHFACVRAAKAGGAGHGTANPKSTPAHAPDVTRYLREIGRRGGLKAKGRPNPASASNLEKARARLAELRSAATQAKPPGARQG